MTSGLVAPASWHAYAPCYPSAMFSGDGHQRLAEHETIQSARKHGHYLDEPTRRSLHAAHGGGFTHMVLRIARWFRRRMLRRGVGRDA